MRTKSITYNEKHNRIVIDDNAAVHNGLLIFILCANLFQSVMAGYRLYSNTNTSSLDMLWIIIGIISVVVLLFMLLRKNISKNIPVKDIKQVYIKKSWTGHRSLIIQLVNGKVRTVNQKINDLIIQQHQNFWEDIAVPFKVYDRLRDSGIS